MIELENEKRKEVYRILKELSKRSKALHVDQIAYVFEKVCYFDFIVCKAKLASSIEAVRARIDGSNPCLNLKGSCTSIIEV